MKLYFLFLISLLATGQRLLAESPAASPSQHNIIGCRIYDMDKKMIRNFPGQLCAFLPDGSLLSGQNDNVVYLDKNSKLLWGQKLHVHHQINRGLGDLAFLLLSSEVKNTVRYDLLQVYDLSGQLKKSYSFFENQKQIENELKRHKLKHKNLPADWIRGILPEAATEFSHANSFYEIDDNVAAKRIPAFKRGNYIVNSSVLRLIFILDNKLKKILWSMPTTQVGCESSHDAQVLNNGNILFLCNKMGPKEVTRLVEYSPVQQKLSWVYPDLAKPSPIKFESLGGVQMLPSDHILFNNLTQNPNRAVEITRQGVELWFLEYPFFDGKTANPTPFQQIKREDLSSFLKNNVAF